MTARSGAVAAVLPAAQSALGVVLLGWPGPVGRALTGRHETVPPRWVVRVLGGRLVAQGAVSLARPTATVALGSAGVDAAHAASMYALAAATRQYRRAALINAAAATATAAVSVGTAIATRGRRR
jgi:hypothetical protein